MTGGNHAPSRLRQHGAVLESGRFGFLVGARRHPVSAGGHGLLDLRIQVCAVQQGRWNHALPAYCRLDGREAQTCSCGRSRVENLAAFHTSPAVGLLAPRMISRPSSTGVLRSSVHSLHTSSGLASWTGAVFQHPQQPTAPVSRMRISAMAPPVLSSTLRHRPQGHLGPGRSPNCYRNNSCYRFMHHASSRAKMLEIHRACRASDQGPGSDPAPLLPARAVRISVPVSGTTAKY